MPLFDELGLRILGTLSGDARFREVQTMHRAEVNMMVCSKALLNVARKLESKYGTPWFEGSFYGVADTSQAFRDFARLIGDPSLTGRTEALIAREEARIHDALEPWRERLRGKRVLLYTGGVKSWSIVSALQDLGMNVVATGTTKSTEEDKKRIRELMGAGRQDDRRRQPPAPAEDRAGLPRGHPDRRRPQHVHGAEGEDAVPRHQPGARLRLRRLRRDARAGPAAHADDREPGLGGGDPAHPVGAIPIHHHPTGDRCPA